MMVELWTRKREMGENDKSDMEDTSGYDILGVWLAWFGLEEAWSGLEDIVLVLLPGGSGLVHALLGKVNWLAYEILSSPNFWWWFPPSPLISLFVVVNSIIT